MSACETNIGEIKSGEGVFSLSRGFTYAGAASIISSLWTVNASSTGEIFPDFYRSLKDGLTKSSALREAKLKFINKSEEGGHIKTPYDWAGFVMMGNDDNIGLNSPRNKTWYLIFILLAGLFLIPVFRKKKKK